MLFSDIREITFDRFLVERSSLIYAVILLLFVGAIALINHSADIAHTFKHASWDFVIAGHDFDILLE